MIEEIKIRRAKIEELKVIQDLNHKLFQSDAKRDGFLNHNWPYEDGEKIFSKMITSPDCVVLVAEVDNKIVGYLAGATIKTESWRPVKRTELENMFVQEKFRSKGIGTKLVKEFLKWSKEKGVQMSLVVAYSSNERAIKFYQKMGFIPESLSLETTYEKAN